MFPEYQELLHRIASSDPHLKHLIARHDELDKQIQEMEAHFATVKPEDIETLKKKKLQFKDQVYRILREASSK